MRQQARSQKPQVDVSAAFVTNQQTAVSVQPGEGALDLPAVPAHVRSEDSMPLLRRSRASPLSTRS